MTVNEQINQRPQTPVWVGYAVAIISVALLTLGLRAIEPIFPLSKFPIPFVLLTMITAYYFGMGPAVTAGILGWLVFTHYFGPRHSFWPPASTLNEWAGQVAFLLGVAVVAIAAVQVRKANKRIQQLADKANEALERERYYSILLQEALLPRIPSMDSGYSVAAEYVPAFVNHQIGGDFYDVIPVGPAKVGILIGDVAGKGLEAAALAATTRSTIHAFVHETTLTSEVLARTNAVLCAQKPVLEEFVTVFLAIIDQNTGDINYSSAGHPPAMICRGGGKVDFMEFGQTPLAVKDSEVFTEYHSRLMPGDKIILYTDGISEARHDLEMLDLEGVARLLTERCDQSAPDIAKSIITAATEWANGKLADDAAVVVVERI